MAYDIFKFILFLHIFIHSFIYLVFIHLLFIVLWILVLIKYESKYYCQTYLKEAAQGIRNKLSLSKHGKMRESKPFWQNRAKLGLQHG